MLSMIVENDAKYQIMYSALKSKSFERCKSVR